MPFVRVEEAEKRRGRFRRVEPGPSIKEGLPAMEYRTMRLDMPSPFEAHEAEEFRLRTLNAQRFSRMYGLPLKTALDNEEDLRRFSYGKDATPKTSWEKMKRAWEIGALARDLGRLRAQQMEGDLSEDLLTRIEELKKKMPTQEQVFSSLPEKAVAKMVEMLPIMTGGIPKGIKVGTATGLAAAGSAAIAGQLGPQIAAPEEIITVPSAFSLMFTAGLSTAMVEDIMRIEAGLAYDELLDLRDEEGNLINPEIARWTAAGVGTINALLEMAQIKLAFKTIPGGDRILRSTATRVIRKAVADGTLKGIVLRNAGRYGAFVTKETGQEIAQETTILLGNRIAGELHETLTDKGVETETAEEAIKRLVATAEQAALGFGVMPIPGMAVGVTREVVTRKRPGMPDQVISERELTEDEEIAIFEAEERELAEKEGLTPDEIFQESIRWVEGKEQAAADWVKTHGEVAFKAQVEPGRYTQAVFVTVTPSVKTPGEWQATLWDEKGPMSDIQRDDYTKMLGELQTEYSVDLATAKPHEPLREPARPEEREPWQMTKAEFRGQYPLAEMTTEELSGLAGREDILGFVDTITDLRKDWKVAVKQNGNIFIGEPGEIHAQLIDREGLNYSEAIPGFVDEKGEWVYQFETAHILELENAVRRGEVISEAALADYPTFKEDMERRGFEVKTEPRPEEGAPILDEYRKIDEWIQSEKPDQTISGHGPLKEVSEKIQKGQVPEDILALMRKHFPKTIDRETGESLWWDRAVEDPTAYPRTGTLMDFYDDFEELERTVEAKAPPKERPLGMVEEPRMKPAWQMSQEEFVETAQTIGRRKEFGSAYDHRRLVKEAVDKGKPVPIGNLEEYKNQQWAQEALDAYEEAQVEEQKPFSLTDIFPEFAKVEGPLDRVVSHMIWELESAKGPERVKTAKGFRSSTEYPDWFRNKGWNKKTVLSALKRRKSRLWLYDLKPIAEGLIYDIGRVYDISVEEMMEIPQEIRDLDKTIKKAERAIKKVLREKEKETAVAERAKYKAAEARKKERQRLRDAAEKLASIIARPAGPSIHIDYREAIEHLQAGIDPSFRTSKTLERRKRIRKYLARHPEAIEQIPTKLLRQINMKAIERYTLKELADIASEITTLRQLGRMKRALEIAQFKREVEGTAATLAYNIAEGKPILKPEAPILGKEKRTIASALQWIRAMSLRPSRIADILDLGKHFKGLFHKTFIRQVNDAENGKLVAIDSRRDLGKAKLEELEITLNDLGKTRTVEGQDFTLDKMIDVYVGWKNPLKKAALMFGNNIDEELAQKVIAELETNEKALGDWIIDEYDNNYQRLRQAYIEHTGEDLGSEESYTPIRRVELTYDPLAQQIADQLLARHNLKKGFPERGFTKARIREIPPAFQKPIRLGAFSTWIGQVNEQEHYIHYAVLIKKLHKILADDQLTEAIKQKFGPDYHEAMKNYLNRTASPTIYKSYEGIDKASRAMRKNVALTYLGINLVTMGKQLPSMALYLGECGPGHLLSSAADFAAHPFEMMEFVKARDPQVKHRKIERELEELKMADASAYSRMQKAIGHWGMMGIYAMDRAAITIGWKAVYDANVNRVGEEEAIRLAQEATLRTQPEAHAKDIADLYAKGEGYNWFLMFTNQLNQIYNLTTHDIPSNVRQGKYYDALLQTTGFVISALVIWIITNKRLPEELDDIPEAIAEQFINSLPLIGRYIVSGAEGWAAGAPAPIEALANVSRVFAKDTKSSQKAKAVLELVSMLVGYPYIGTKRIVEAVVEEEPGLLLGAGGRKRKKTRWRKR